MREKKESEIVGKREPPAAALISLGLLRGYYYEDDSATTYCYWELLFFIVFTVGKACMEACYCESFQTTHTA